MKWNERSMILPFSFFSFFSSFLRRATFYFSVKWVWLWVWVSLLLTWFSSSKYLGSPLLILFQISNFNLSLFFLHLFFSLSFFLLHVLSCSSLAACFCCYRLNKKSFFYFFFVVLMRHQVLSSSFERENLLRETHTFQFFQFFQFSIFIFQFIHSYLSIYWRLLCFLNQTIVVVVARCDTCHHSSFQSTRLLLGIYTISSYISLSTYISMKRGGGGEL